MVRPLNLINKQFGRLTVVERAENASTGQTRWRAQCQCGVFGVFYGSHLVSGHTTSCGCWQVETITKRSTKHGSAPRGGKTREYLAWLGMKDRCTNPNDKSYTLYGAKGISVCKQWRDSFPRFLADMGPCPSGFELDRIDNAKGYNPKNCRWASEVDQSRNRGFCKLSIRKARVIRRYKGPLKDIAAKYKVDVSTIKRVRANKSWVE